MKILILAGGKGTRLWPLSRQYKPKQFQKLFGKKTMLQETISRVLPLVPLRDIYVATNQQYIKEVQKELPKLPKRNIISEPAYRERVAAFLLFLCYLKEEELKEPVVILPSDHLIKEKGEFHQALITGEKFVKKNPEYLLLLGEKPAFPDTGLGYIKKGEFFKKEDNFKIYHVSYFKEKPNLKRTKEFLKSKNYFWNVGIFIFTSQLIEKLIEKFVPNNYRIYQKIKKSFAKNNFKEVLAKEYLEMDNVSFEESILENYKKNALLPISIGWSDVGNWTVLRNFIKGNHIDINSKNIFVYGPANKLITTVGLKDLIIVAIRDIILICHRNSTQDIKKLVKKIEENKKFKYR